MIVCAGILSGSAAAIVVINRTEPTAQQIEATRKSAALVETVMVERGNYSPRLVVLGTVRPAQEVVLSPRVSGQIIELSPKFVPGGMIRQGEELLRIDPADFENALAVSQTELEQAEASLAIEEGRQSLARQELELLKDTITDANRDLVLRMPQIRSIQAQVNAAKAAIAQAKLDLARTRVKAPFDAQIISRAVNVGSQVSPGDELAQLVGIDEYWIMASIPVRSLHWVKFLDSEGQGSAVKLRNPDTWPSGMERDATVTRMIGTLDQQTRLARVLITAADPLAKNTDAPPLILDTLLEVHIECRPIEDVVRLDRDYVHERDTVWVMREGQLEIRETEILFHGADYAYIRTGLESGDKVVTTTLATVADGIGLKEMPAPTKPAAASQKSNGEAAD